jgi:hypothetical protein
MSSTNLGLLPEQHDWPMATFTSIYTIGVGAADDIDKMSTVSSLLFVHHVIHLRCIFNANSYSSSCAGSYDDVVS